MKIDIKRGKKKEEKNFVVYHHYLVRNRYMIAKLNTIIMEGVLRDWDFDCGIRIENDYIINDPYIKDHGYRNISGSFLNELVGKETFFVTK